LRHRLPWDKFLAEQPAVVGSDGELVRIGIAVTDALLPIFDSRFKKLKLPNWKKNSAISKPAQNLPPAWRKHLK